MHGMAAPPGEVSERDLDRATTNLMWDASFATAVGALNSGVVLAAFALHLGASNFQIGLLAAIPFLTQLIQAPAVLLVERLRRRRLISTWSLFVGRLALPVFAVLPFLSNRELALALLILIETLHCAFNALGACSWNSWIRDLVPEERLGAFFARRTVWATAISLTGTIIAGYALDRFASGGERDLTFAGLYLAGFLCGIGSIVALARVAEPAMGPPAPGVKLTRLLRAPLRDRNFRSLIRFLASWQFAVNTASPFFTVYFVQRLGFPISFVLALTVVTQVSNIFVLSGWGRLSDRYSNKSVLTVAAPAYILCIAALTLASQIDGKVTAGAYLVVLHVFMGLSAAGVGLASGNIALKLAPRGAATAYVAANALVTSLAAGVAPILGGLFADFFAARELSIAVQWTRPGQDIQVLDLAFGHWDFYFLIAALLGLYALHRLTMIEEQGEVDRAEVVEHIATRTRQTVRNLSPVAGLRAMTAFPAGAILQRRRRGKAARMAGRTA